MIASEVPMQSCMRTSSGTPSTRKNSYSTGTMTAPPPMPNSPARMPVTTPAAITAAASHTSSATGTVIPTDQLQRRLNALVRRALPKPCFDRLAGDGRVRQASHTSIREAEMAVFETERHGQVLVVRMNRPERLNALNLEMRSRLAETWTEFRESNELEVAIFTGAGRGFCAGEDMKESLQRGKPGGTRPDIEDPFMSGALEKPVIAAVNGYAMGGGFMLVERTDLRVAAKGAVFEVSEAKRWLLGGYNHGHIANLPYPIAMEMALGFRFTAERFHQVGFLNRLVSAEELMPAAFAMAEHLLTLPPASRVNTVHMMRQMRPAAGPEMQRLAAALQDHGAKTDLMESRAAFAEKRAPQFKGWDDPADRYRLPTLDTAKG